MEGKTPLEVLLRRVRLKMAREGGEAKNLFKGIIDEVRQGSGYDHRRCWELSLELVAEELGILDEPWRYSLPDLPKSPHFKGNIKPVKREVPKDLAERVRQTGLIEEFVEAARAKPWDYIGEVFLEERLSNNRLGQMLTPRAVVQLMIQMVLTEYKLKKERVWVDFEALAWAESYLRTFGYPPLWMSEALKRAAENIEELSRPQTILDPAVGTGRFLIEASLMNPEEPLALFGIDIDPWMYRACLVNMALFSKHPYSIICADSLRIDEKYAGPSSPLWDLGNTWQPADVSAFYAKPPPATPTSFSLARWL
ncbi:MAG: TRM11 family SAM-dependent methyltransferase [Candidatus Bathycorpusculaceae bacterium]